MKPSHEPGTRGSLDIGRKPRGSLDALQSAGLTDGESLSADPLGLSSSCLDEGGGVKTGQERTAKLRPEQIYFSVSVPEI